MKKVVVSRKLKKISFFVSVLLVAVIFNLCFISKPLFADTNTPIDKDGPTPSSSAYGGNNHTPYYGVGDGSFSGHYSWVKIYVPIGQPTTVSINQFCAPISVGGGRVTYQLKSLSDTEELVSGNRGPVSDQVDLTYPSTQCSEDLTFSIGGSKGIPSTRQGHEKLRVFYLLATMESRGSYVESYYRVNSSASGSYVGATKPVEAARIDDFYGIYQGDASGEWDYTVMFATDCHETIHNPAQLKIHDPDNGDLQQNMTAILESSPRDRASPAWSRVEDWDKNQVQGGPWGASNTTASLGFNASEDFIYKFTVRNIGVVNTLQVQLPYDQIDAKASLLDNEGCHPPQKKWKLDPGTIVTHQIGGYTPAYPNPQPSDTSPSFAARKQANVSRAKAAFDDARFKHYVNEKDGKRDALDGEHRWKVQFEMIRAGGAVSPIYDKDPPLNNLTVKAEAAGPAGILVDNSRPNINSNEMKFLFRSLDDSEYRNPVDGDQYCERVNNTYFDANKGTVINDPSTWKCVTLGDTTCISEPWVVKSSKSITGDGDPTDAWVGQNFSFNYSFSNGGPASQTGNIDFYHNTFFPNKTHNQTLGSYDTNRGVTIAAGDTTINDRIEWTPNSGNADCTTGPGGRMDQQIVVPPYYHLKPKTTMTNGNGTQQGDPIDVGVNVSLPDQDDQGDLTGGAAGDNEFGGRRHTNSAPTTWRIIEFTSTDPNTVATAKAQLSDPPSYPNRNTNGSGDCAEINGFGIAGFDTAKCATVSSGTDTFLANATKQFSYRRLGNITDPVGTNVCYVGVVGKPTHNPGPAWRYSNVSCTTVVKSPKVQFLNGDLTVGRHRLGDPLGCNQTPAIIQGVGASAGAASAPPPINVYGSWVEYGAFASSNIIGFGTAAYAKTAANNEQKLMFSNTPSTGNYDYDGNCLSPIFDLVKPPNTNDITTAAPSLPLNQYFTANPNDKTGFVSDSQNITLVQSGAPPLDANFDGFKGRDIIIYAKSSNGGCGGNGGTITINTDITYKKAGYSDISELPRIILLADCKIIIDDAVKNVDAWLIAKDAVETCSAATGAKFANNTVKQGDCPDQLVVNGPVQAGRLLLWRTHGADLSNLATAREAGEIFDLRPDQILSTYARGRDAGKPHTIYQTDLPPLY